MADIGDVVDGGKWIIVLVVVVAVVASVIFGVISIFS